MNKDIISDYSPENNNLYEERKGPQYFVPIGIFMAVCFIAVLCLEWKIVNAVSKDLEETELVEVVGEPIENVPVKEDHSELIVAKIDHEALTEPIKVIPTDDDILAAVAMSEAGNQDLLGKVFVILTVLNRADYYDMTVDEVVTAPNQYSYPYYGKITHECYTAVEIAREYRDIAPSIMWFRTGTFHDIGTPAFKWGDHYFSKMEVSE